MSVAILNALKLLDAENVEGVKIPSRKELTKLLKNTQVDNLFKALDEVNHIRIRRVPAMECTGTVGIVGIAHPVNTFYCLIHRDPSIKDGEIKLTNAALGEDTVIIKEETFNDKLYSMYTANYQIFLDTGEKQPEVREGCSCNDCAHYCFDNEKETCLYDNSNVTDSNYCCNKYTDCFKWKHLK